MSTEAAIFIALALAALFAVFFLMVKWARTRSGGAMAFGALMTMFAPDPTLEAQIRLAEENKQQQVEEDEEGEPKD